MVLDKIVTGEMTLYSVLILLKLYYYIQNTSLREKKIERVSEGILDTEECFLSTHRTRQLV